MGRAGGGGRITRVARRVNTRERHRRVLVITGGVKTEPAYLHFLRDKLGTSGVTIQVVESGRDPLRLVDEAIVQKSQDALDAKRSRDSSNVFDSVWVMTDVDDFEKAIPQALAKAANDEVQVAVSNPCFEIWLLWHASDHGYGSTKTVQTAAQAAGVTTGKNGKELVVSAVDGKYQEARDRAVARQAAHSRNDVQPPSNNPSSDVYLLVEGLLAAARHARPASDPSLT
jgi:hypothetical protein